MIQEHCCLSTTPIIVLAVPHILYVFHSGYLRGCLVYVDTVLVERFCMQRTRFEREKQGGEIEGEGNMTSGDGKRKAKEHDMKSGFSALFLGKK